MWMQSIQAMWMLMLLAPAVQAHALNASCPENPPFHSEVSLLQVGASKIRLGNSGALIFSKYQCTFAATGCPSVHIPADGGTRWPTMEDASVFNAMYTFCTKTSSGTAAQWQREFCCGGDNPDCTNQGPCVKQTEWTETCAPTAAPTTAPTEAPTTAPTTAPTEAPTEAPTTAPTLPPKPPGEPLPTSPDPRFRWVKYESKFFGNYASGDSKMRAFEEAQKRCVELGYDQCGGITCGPASKYVPSTCTVRYGYTPHDSEHQEDSYSMIPVKEGETPPAPTPTEPPAPTGPPPTWETHENKVLGDDVAEANTNFICQDASKERCPPEEAKERCWQLGPEKCGGITCGGYGGYFCQLKHGTTLHDAPNGQTPLKTYVMVPAPSALMSYSKH